MRRNESKLTLDQTCFNQIRILRIIKILLSRDIMMYRDVTRDENWHDLYDYLDFSRSVDVASTLNGVYVGAEAVKFLRQVFLSPYLAVKMTLHNVTMPI